MSRNLLEENTFDAIIQVPINNNNGNVSRMDFNMYVAREKRPIAIGVNGGILRNEARKRSLITNSSVAAEYAAISRRNEVFWMEKYGYELGREIHEIIAKGRIKLFLNFNTKLVSENDKEDWKLLIEYIRGAGGKIAAYGYDEVGNGASEIFMEADEKYALPDTEFSWRVKRPFEDEAFEELEDLLKVFGRETLQGNCTDFSLCLLKAALEDREVREIFIRRSGIDLQESGMISGLSWNIEMIRKKVEAAMLEALGISIASKQKPALLP